MNRSSVVLVLVLAGSASLELATSGMIDAVRPPERACATSPSVAPAATACAAVDSPVTLEVVDPVSTVPEIVKLEAAVAHAPEAAGRAQLASSAPRALVATGVASDRTPVPQTASPRPVAQQPPPEVLRKRRLMQERQALAQDQDVDANGRLVLRKPVPNPQTSAKLGLQAGLAQRSGEPQKAKPTWVNAKTRELPIEKVPPPK